MDKEVTRGGSVQDDGRTPCQKHPNLYNMRTRKGEQKGGMGIAKTTISQKNKKTKKERKES